MSFVLNSADIAERLDATPAQIRQVQHAQAHEYRRHQAALEPLRKAFFQAWKTGNPPPRARRLSARMERLGQAYLAHCRRILDETLTAQQRARLKALLGKPFTAKKTSDVRPMVAD